MGFIQKIGKWLGVGLMIGGGVVSIPSAVIIGLGTNATYKMDDGAGKELVMGVGSMNYGRVWLDGVEGPSADIGSYKDFIKSAHDFIDMTNKNTATEAEKQKALELPYKALEAFDMMVAGSVLLPISVIVLAVGITLFVIAKKKA